MSEWKVFEFKDVLVEPVRNGIYKRKEFHGRGAKIVNMGELFAYPRLFDVEMKRVVINDAEKQKSCLEEGDLLFARRSLTAEGAGKCAVVKKVIETTTFESSIIRARPNKKLACSDYLFYFFESPTGKHKLDTIRRQVAVAGITGSDLSQLKIPLPPLPIQRRIADILGTLDAKIELNRRTSATLEQMAQALFKSWFVDFDPVYAKAAGRRLKGLAPEIARLFPNEFEDSPLGPIPKGWRVGTVGDYVDTISVTHRFPEKQIIFLNTSDILDGDVLTHKYSDSDTLPGQAKKSIRKNDILYSEIRPANKRYAFIGFDAEDYVVSTKLMVLRAKSWIDNLVIYYYLKSEPVVRELQRLAEARSGTFPQITFDVVKVFPLVFPPSEVMQIFTATLRSIFDKSESCKSQSYTLSVLRDTLIPKLMSDSLHLSGLEQLEEGTC